MKKHGILNSEISKVLSDLGHTDKIVIADAGLPVPREVPKIDLALSLSEPSFIRVLELVLEDMKVESVLLADEIVGENMKQHDAVRELMVDEEVINFISHEDFKERLWDAKAVIRTGEATPYSNIILQAGVLF
ncbi:MAG: D-ribose pyranase [Atopostipes suicloacalis]|nr:D-ribose pyranase [Atopostipes suicloacalis]MDN6730548.1 D-ribose pyranase [Atopostipes suicloacalis]